MWRRIVVHPPVRPPPLPRPLPLVTPRRRVMREVALELLVGTGVLRVASTTCCPAVRPVAIWVTSGPAAPRVTRVTTGLPFFSTVTVLKVPMVCRAVLGTVRALTTWVMSMVTAAPAPSTRAEVVGLSRIVTG